MTRLIKLRKYITPKNKNLFYSLILKSHYNKIQNSSYFWSILIYL